MIRFTLNEEHVTYDGTEDRSLLDFLREDADIRSVKNGCSGQAFCGACLVEIEGKPALSCVTKMGKMQGKKVRTLGGFPEDVKSAVAKVFVKNGAVQCGFCTPGILTRILILLKENPSPTRQDVVDSLRMNYCRCTGYKKIFDAVLEAAELLREQKTIELSPEAGVGKNREKYGAYERALGQAPFTEDLHFPGMLYGVLLFAEHPRAVVRDIDFSDAEQLPGVVRIFTARDIPGSRITGLIKKDWPMMVAQGEMTRCLGDVIAVIAAESREEAEKARDQVRVVYDILEPVSDPVEALKNSVKVHDSGNLLDQTVIYRGIDSEEELRSSAYKAEGRFTTQRIEHAFLEPEAAVAMPWEKTGVELFVQSQGVYEDRAQIAQILQLPESSINITLLPTGGGFGGKEDMTVQHHAALCAFLLQKPVKIRLSREESIRMHPKRHPVIMDFQLGCSSEGKLTALKARIIGDTGAYASVGMKVLERAAGHATGAYHIPSADIISKAVYTNNVPCGAMRGFGVNQVTFAVEALIDQLCEQGGFDRWQFRFDNALTEGSVTATGQVLKAGVGVRSCLQALKNEYNSHKYTGLACGIKNTGIGNGMKDESDALVQITEEGRVILHHGWTEMGQGVDTIALQVFCQETGVDPELVDVLVSTQFGAKAGMTTASRATALLGNAMKDAAVKAAKDLDKYSLSELAGKEYTGHWECGWTTKPGAPGEAVTHFSYGYAAQLVVLNDEGGVDTVYAAHDAGKVMNPKLFEGQIEGAVVMGLGYALSEDLPMKDSRFLTYKMRDLGLPRAKDVPNITVIPVEETDPVGPYGAKGVGEIGLVPTAAAYANAWYQYSGQRIYHLPANKERKQ